MAPEPDQITPTITTMTIDLQLFSPVKIERGPNQMDVGVPAEILIDVMVRVASRMPMWARADEARSFLEFGLVPAEHLPDGRLETVLAVLELEPEPLVELGGPGAAALVISQLFGPFVVGNLAQHLHVIPFIETGRSWDHRL